jgi:hypothetical protein
MMGFCPTTRTEKNWLHAVALVLAAAIAAVSPLLSSGVLSANLSTRLRDALPPALIATLPLIGGAAFLAMFLSIREIWIRERLGPFWAFLRAHRPVYLIFAGTPAGFNLLHFGSAALLLLAGSVWA